jgi:hypothetical protein
MEKEHKVRNNMSGVIDRVRPGAILLGGSFGLLVDAM